MGVQFSHEIIIFGGDCKLVYHIFHRTVNLGPNNIPAILRRSKIWRLSILHYIHPPPPNVNRINTPTPHPTPTNCLRTLYDVLHDVHGIKMRFHHCNDELIFVID